MKEIKSRRGKSDKRQRRRKEIGSRWRKLKGTANEGNRKTVKKISEEPNIEGKKRKWMKKIWLIRVGWQGGEDKQENNDGDNWWQEINVWEK